MATRRRSSASLRLCHATRTTRRRSWVANSRLRVHGASSRLASWLAPVSHQVQQGQAAPCNRRPLFGWDHGACPRESVGQQALATEGSSVNAREKRKSPGPEHRQVTYISKPMPKLDAAHAMTRVGLGRQVRMPGADIRSSPPTDNHKAGYFPGATFTDTMPHFPQTIPPKVPRYQLIQLPLRQAPDTLPDEATPPHRSADGPTRYRIAACLYPAGPASELGGRGDSLYHGDIK
jgi:hypothetical protein